MNKIIQNINAMNNSKFRMFYGDYKRICDSYTKIRTYSTKASREEDEMLIGRYSRILNQHGFAIKHNPWENVQQAYMLKDIIEQEAKRREII